ncbi:hypothetical protein [Prochlorococcus sp. MIT 1341]|uniref:hypothetical protein n=1 Tax=Prochlorococcus sp. MIT 1341 TaxID=3096221 RepID=UPI002A755ED2|nr:hypothetical protein [Prochlorococcus sp. MIT 1341]
MTINLQLPLPDYSPTEPRSMKWESNGELAHRDLSELVNRLLDVESQNHSNELSRLGNKYNETS